MATEKGLRGILLRPTRSALERELGADYPGALRRKSAVLEEARRQLLEYLDGMRRGFDMDLDFGLVTPFQNEVYLELLRLPYGATITYGELAARLKRPLAVRAVGRALASNPLALIVPCHRVVGKSGILRGFSAGEGVATQKRLLALEAAPTLS